MAHDREEDGIENDEIGTSDEYDEEDDDFWDPYDDDEDLIWG